jgi:hypothetical protein
MIGFLPRLSPASLLILYLLAWKERGHPEAGALVCCVPHEIDERGAMEMMTPGCKDGGEPAIPRARNVVTLYSCLAFSTTFLSAIQMLAILFSITGLGVRRPQAIMILAVSCAISLLVARSAAKRSACQSSPATSLLPSWVKWTMLSVTLVCLVEFAIVGALAGDRSWDGNAYHIPPMNQWSVQGRIAEVDAAFNWSQFMNGYPKGAETVSFVVAQAFTGRLAPSLDLWFAPLGLLGIALLCRLMGFASFDGIALGCAFLLVPANLIQYGTTYVDAAFGFSAVALLALLAFGLMDTDTPGWAEAVVLGCAIGNVISIKASGPEVVLIALAVFALFALRDLRARRQLRLSWLVTVIAACLIALPSGGFWYARNHVLHGSPIYPAGLTVAGHTIWPGESVSAVMRSEAQIPPRILGLNPVRQCLISWFEPLRTRLWTHPGSDDIVASADIRLGGLGALWIVGCIPAIVLAAILLSLRRNRDIAAKRLFVFLATAIALCFLATPMNWWARYTVWLFALGMPSIAFAFSQGRKSQKSLLRTGALIWILLSATGLYVRALSEIFFDSVVPFAQLSHNRYHVPVFKFYADPPPLPLFPEMRSPLLNQILNEAAIGVGPEKLDDRPQLIYGQLSTPLGRHNLIPIPQGIGEESVHRYQAQDKLRYILWLTAAPIPAPLARHSMAKATDGPFTYLELSPE